MPELNCIYGSDGLPFDTAKIYDMYWKGYFPQDFSYLAASQTVVMSYANPWKWRGDNSPPFTLTLLIRT